LHSDERAVLDLLLSRDFPGRAELARQAETALTAGSSCSCGCPSFSLVADQSLPPAAIREPRLLLSPAVRGTDLAHGAVIAA
jgi:hypothetical protein